MFDKAMNFLCAAGGAMFLTLSLPELLYYAPPIVVITYTGGFILLAISIKATFIK